MTPRVSVIISTFNRSHLLRHAIESVCASTLQDWELIIIGDHCTDASEQVACAFEDPRIRFHNLPVNCGEQSGPNNFGVALATGEYVTFLNHDDMYFPDHLENAVREMQIHDADFGWVAGFHTTPCSAAVLAAGDWLCELNGVPINSTYDPLLFVIATNWIFKRALVKSIGPWKHAASIQVSSSQEWLFRVYRSGARMHFIKHASVLLIFSGLRDRSYTATESPEHAYYSARLQQAGPLRNEMLEKAAFVMGEKLHRTARFTPWSMRLFAIPVRISQILAERLGVHPRTPEFWLRFAWRGGFINMARRRGGLGRLGKPAKTTA